MSSPETKQILHAENLCFFLINGLYGRHPEESQTQREDKLKGWVGKGIKGIKGSKNIIFTAFDASLIMYQNGHIPIKTTEMNERSLNVEK